MAVSKSTKSKIFIDPILVPTYRHTGTSYGTLYLGFLGGLYTL